MRTAFDRRLALLRNNFNNSDYFLDILSTLLLAPHILAKSRLLGDAPHGRELENTRLFDPGRDGLECLQFLTRVRRFDRALRRFVGNAYRKGKPIRKLDLRIE